MPDDLVTAVIRMTGQHGLELRRNSERLEKTVDFKAHRAGYSRGNLIDEPDKTHGRKAT